MSESPQNLSLRVALAGRWQMPLLAVGLLLFCGGLIRIGAAYRPVTYQDELDRVTSLRERGALIRANAYLLDLLRDVERPNDQRAEFHRLLATTVHQVERPLRSHRKQNIHSIITNFRSALRYGASPGADDWIAVADAYYWSGNDAEAEDAYREVLRFSPDRADQIRRRLVEMHLDDGPVPSAQTLADVDDILDDASSSPVVYLWAMERKVDWLLAEGEAPQALALVAEGKVRLSGTPEKPAVLYSEALCLCKRGDCYSAEAESVLRSLLSDWTVRDRLWGRATWLLGRLQQADERPQAALVLFDDVLRSFQAGELHDGCKLGRAECLASLERYARSLETFRAIQDRFVPGHHHPYLERSAVRTTVIAIGESLFQAGDLEMGVEYMRLGLLMMDASDEAARIHVASRIATGLSQMAKAAASDRDKVENRKSKTESRKSKVESRKSKSEMGRADALFVQAGEAYLSLAEAQSLDPDGAAESLESAAESFDSAGMTERVIEVLARLTRTYLGYSRRATALRQLGQACQAARRYPEAVAAYEEAIETYPRLLAAHASMVPMAECLIAIGGDSSKRGVEVLIGIVDASGEKKWFGPEAKEYRDALLRLVEYYDRATEDEEPGHLEKAIVRLENAVALYPDDPQMVRLKFLLADAYRGSGLALRDQDLTGLAEDAVATMHREVRRRLARAMEIYDQMISVLAAYDEPSLSDLERTYLRMSYLYRSDCLFELERYGEAIDSYNETVWRYEDLPAAISASMQIVHSYQRLGDIAEARAALERMGWLLRKIPAAAFETERGMSSKAYWESMVDRLQRTGVY